MRKKEEEEQVLQAKKQAARLQVSTELIRPDVNKQLTIACYF